MTSVMIEMMSFTNEQKLALAEVIIRNENLTHFDKPQIPVKHSDRELEKIIGCEFEYDCGWVVGIKFDSLCFQIESIEILFKK